MEAEMRKATPEDLEWKAQMSSKISHEFRTPMSTILSSAELLEMYGNRLDDAKRLEHLKRIQEAVLQMTKILNTLSDNGEEL